ncbi:hypothetical protein [uncultured Thiodictyon sp.]|uniref:hypothetical protein n=1 Tax=uncultured Thiodictyon sp. TaxID=1846217 RepID=UPI0025DA918B|nr:hypothetical protein [uncultured Thiodictyon sp.]
MQRPWRRDQTGDLDPRYHRWLLDAFDKRQIGDYGIDAVLTQEEVREMIERADILLAETTRYLTAPEGS